MVTSVYEIHFPVKLFLAKHIVSLVQVTDGVQNLEAMEYQPIPALSTALRLRID